MQFVSVVLCFAWLGWDVLLFISLAWLVTGVSFPGWRWLIVGLLLPRFYICRYLGVT